MIVNLVSLVNELVNGLNGQLKMVNVIKQITTSKNITNFKNWKKKWQHCCYWESSLFGSFVQTFRVKKKNVKKIIYQKQQLERLKTIEQYTDNSRAEHALLEVSVEVVKQKSGKFFMVFH